jgi:hypothetical protein
MPERGDSGVYVYGVVPATSAVPSTLRGMDGKPVESVVQADLAAVVTEVALPRPAGRRKDLLSHSEVLNAVAERHDVVPLRFGTMLADRRAVVADVLERQHHRFTSTLERIAGAVQLNLRATYVEERVLADILKESPRIRSLRERTRGLPPGLPHPDMLELGRLVALRVEDLRREDGAQLMESLLPLVLDVRNHDRAGTEHVLDVAMLVERRSVEVLETHLERVARDVHERMGVALTGPLAAFDFVEEEAWV